MEYADYPSRLTESYPSRLTVMEILARLGKPPDLMLEIGSNDGEDTLQFASAFPNSQIVAFEPDPRAIAKFESVMMKAGIYSDRCQLVEAAISDVTGMTTLYMSAGAEGFHEPEWDKSSSICRPTRHLVRSPEITFPDDETHRIQIPTLTLDAWWGIWKEDHPHEFIDFIWCDPQGAQGKIIRGGTEALAHTRWLYIEFYLSPLYEEEPTLTDILEMLPGWSPVDFYERYENVLLRNDELELAS